MGTSVNQRSPDTPNWDIVQRAYEDPNIPTERALREIWRAAMNQERGDLAALLGDPAIAAFAGVAATAASPAEATREAGRLIAETKSASLAADIARRAAVQSAGRENAREFFNQRLFAEATNYLVARDIPGHINEGTRLDSASAAREFKRRLTDTAAQAALTNPGPAEYAGPAWTAYVRSVLSEIVPPRRRRQ